MYHTHACRLYYTICRQSFIDPIIICTVLASVVHTFGDIKQCYVLKFAVSKFVFSYDIDPAGSSTVQASWSK